VQAKKQHCKGVALRLVKYGQESTATREQQGTCIVHRVDEEYRHWHQAAQNHHEHREAQVHSLEQPIESQRNEIHPAAQSS
jgi:hypothetical protein